jgi:oligosaccharide translocation protein RFT1
MKIRNEERNDSRENDNGKDLKSTISGFKLMLTQQFASRLITFACNIYITRLLTLDTLGIIQDLDLFHSSILFLCRETSRMAVIRTTSSLQLQVNFSYIPFTVFILCFSSYSFIFEIDSSYHLFLFAAGVELISEPFYTFCQLNLLYNIRLKCECLSFLLQNIFNMSTIYIFKELLILDPTLGIQIYALSKVVYALSLIGSYYINIKSHMNIDLASVFLPKKVVQGQQKIWLDENSIKIAFSFLFQTIIKHLLTVSDKISLIYLGIENHTKGAYSIVSDLGIDLLI